MATCKLLFFQIFEDNSFFFSASELVAYTILCLSSTRIIRRVPPHQIFVVDGGGRVFFFFKKMYKILPKKNLSQLFSMDNRTLNLSIVAAQSSHCWMLASSAFHGSHTFSRWREYAYIWHLQLTGHILRHKDKIYINCPCLSSCGSISYPLQNI